MPQFSLPDTLLWDGITKKEMQAIKEVYVFIFSYLDTVTRRSGESYATHSFEVASTLNEVLHDPTLISLSLLHDVLLHPEGERLFKIAPLSPSEKNILQDLHSLRRLHIDSDLKDLDTTIQAFTRDIRLLFIRMAHRLSDIRNIKRYPKDLQEKLTKETLQMYCPLAGRLGLHAWRKEMEDKCFMFLMPRYANKLKKLFEASKETDLICLEHTKSFLEKKLLKSGVVFSIEHRIKGIYSSYQKILLKNRSFYEITDRLAIRIIVKNIEDCYKVLGIIHTSMHPIPGKLKDYIGSPKENGYQSIHTVIYPLPGITDRPIEIQIRTQAIHNECEVGFVAHYQYKKNGFSDLQYTAPLKVNLIRNLEIIHEESRSTEQFSEALKHYSRGEKILIFDTDNNFYSLKPPATALDFVCLTEKEDVAYLKSVLINGREQPFHTKLHDGDTVEVFLHVKKQKTPDWQHMCLHNSSKKILKSIQ